MFLISAFACVLSPLPGKPPPPTWWPPIPGPLLLYGPRVEGALRLQSQPAWIPTLGLLVTLASCPSHLIILDLHFSSGKQKIVHKSEDCYKIKLLSTHKVTEQSQDTALCTRRHHLSMVPSLPYPRAVFSFVTPHHFVLSLSNLVSWLAHFLIQELSGAPQYPPKCIQNP